MILDSEQPLLIITSFVWLSPDPLESYQASLANMTFVFELVSIISTKQTALFNC